MDCTLNINGFDVLIDEGDLVVFNMCEKWVIDKGYALGRFKVNGKSVADKMHRLIMDAQKGQIVDHIDGNKLNNKRSNLRFVTHAENMRNKSKKKNCICQSYGVTLNKHKNLYHASCIYEAKVHSFGYFKSEIAAAYHYNKCVSKISKFYKLNTFDISTEELEFIVVRDKPKKPVSEKQSGVPGISWYGSEKNKYWHVIYKRKQKGCFKNLQDAIDFQLKNNFQLK